MRCSLLSLLFTCASTAALAGTVNGTAWDDASRFQLRARAIGIMPDEQSSVSAGGALKVGNAAVPEVDISYFFTDHVAAELIAATAQHSVSHNALGDLGSAWVLPPTLTLQYHLDREQAFSPYIGAGVNYTMMYGEDAAKGNGINRLQVGNGFGYALQAGADYWFDEHWGANIDVKKIWVNMDASVNSGGVTADLDLDPWVIGAGVAYRF